MTDENVPGSDPSTTEATNSADPTATKTPVKKAARKAKTKSAGGAKAKAKAARKTKSAVALAIFKQHSRGKTIDRAKVISLFKSEAGLTAAGASTYYQKFKTALKGKAAS